MKNSNEEIKEQDSGGIILNQVKETKDTMNANSYRYLDLLRIIGAVLIVLVHVAAFNIEDLSFPSGNLFATNIFSHLAITGVPLFVMISGALMLAPEYELSYRKLLLKKIPHLVIVYTLWLIIYNLINCYREGYGYSFSSLKEHVALHSILGYGIYHLWFLPMLIGLYLATPIIRKVVTDKKLCEYFLILYFIFAIFLPTILKFEFRFKTIVESFYNRIPYLMFVGYIGFYILGYYLHTFVPKLQREKRILLGILGILGIAGGSVVSYCRALSRGAFSQILNEPFALNVFLVCICLFLLVREMNDYLVKKRVKVAELQETSNDGSCSLNEPHSDKQRSDILKYLSSLTMGIYLIHPAVLWIADGLALDTLFLPSVISIPISLIVIVLVSAILIMLLKVIPGIRKILL